MVSLSINVRYINVNVYFFNNLNYSMNNTRNCSFKLYGTPWFVLMYVVYNRFLLLDISSY